MNWFNDLLKLDISLARLLGAPKGATLSGHAYVMEQEGKPWGKVCRPLIDWGAKTFFDQDNHCYKAHLEDLQRA